jgi:hypothetical protein
MPNCNNNYAILESDILLQSLLDLAGAPEEYATVLNL